MPLGKFITVEGGEGVGKSTFCRLLCEKFKQSGIPLHQTREPGGSPMADRIRHLFVSPPKEDPITPLGELYLISAARAQHVAYAIRPNLQKGVWILCDRFADSTRVYQGELGKLDANMLEDVIRTSTEGLIPDVTYILDCPAEIALERIQASATKTDERTGASRYDHAALDIHQKMRAAYGRLAARFPERMKILDATKPVEVVVESAWKDLQSRFAGAWK